MSNTDRDAVDEWGIPWDARIWLFMWIDIGHTVGHATTKLVGNSHHAPLWIKPYFKPQRRISPIWPNFVARIPQTLLKLPPILKFLLLQTTLSLNSRSQGRSSPLLPSFLRQFFVHISTNIRKSCWLCDTWKRPSIYQPPLSIFGCLQGRRNEKGITRRVVRLHSSQVLKPALGKYWAEVLEKEQNIAANRLMPTYY